ncbi:endonuclease domain-containing protein [Demequina oxidasica]|uniref:endonuclease domain-containing protein n=1 Tax=Demequina oxidasica TaxID=676199 RepID=UPI0009FF05C0|nr:DUF559 domain-containing protein [Demequina oxidasica]
MRLIPGVPEPSGCLSDFLAANAHAFSRADLVADWSRHQLDSSVRSSSIVRVLPGVYSARVHASNPVVLGEAANLWCPRGLVTGELALHLYANGLQAPTYADLVVAQGDAMHAPRWVRVHQTGLPRYRGSAEGVHCVTPERALMDAWRFAKPALRRGLLYESLWARVCSWRQLQHELNRTPRVAGRRDLELLLGWFAEGATTPLEVLAKHETFANVRFREFEWQVKLRLGQRHLTVDMLHRKADLVVELDGDRYHSTREARDADRERQTDLAAAGFLTVRFGWNDLFRRPAWCRDRLLRALESRLARPSST